MKRVKLLIVAVFMVLLSGLSWVGIASAQAVTSHVKKGQTIDGSVYGAGQTVRIQGTVNGDVHCAAQEVTIEGTVKGDVLCAAQRIEIRGTVEGSVRVAAQDVLIASTIGRSVSLAAERVMITEKANIAKDATIAASQTDVRGLISRDATIASAKATINGSVARHISYTGGDLSIGNKGIIGGGISYQSDRSISIADSAVVKGKVERESSDKKKNSNSWLFTLVLFLALMLFALMTVLIWPQAVHSTSDLAVKSLGKTLLVGLLGLFVAPLALVLLAATLIGIPIAIFGFLAWALIMFLSGPVAGYYLGSMILSRAKNPIIIMLFGASLLLVLYSLPVLSFFASLFAALVGGGAIIRKLMQRIPKPRYIVE